MEGFDVSRMAVSQIRKEGVVGFVVSNFSGIYEFGKIRIPKKFNERYGVYIPSEVLLVMDNGDTWSSIYDHSSSNFVGLEEFMRFYGVKTYWFLVINYLGGVKFSLNICSPKCVEILYPEILCHTTNAYRNELVDIGVFDYHGITEVKRGALLYFNLGFCNFGYFSFLVQSRHLNDDSGKVVVCEGMYHILKRFVNAKKITVWLLRTKWEIEIQWHNHQCVFEFNVCVFKQEEYDFAMFNTDFYGVKFFQIVFPHSLQGYRIVLPIIFGDFFGNFLSLVVEFVMPTNQAWSISYEGNPPRFLLLKEFSLFYGLRENFILLFEYLGHSRFFVRIFDQNSVEILYPNSSKALEFVDKFGLSKYPIVCDQGEEGTLSVDFVLIWITWTLSKE